jgi:putative transposase
MIIRSSRHIINNCNDGKLTSLNNLFDDYKKDLVSYINLIINEKLLLKNMLSSKELPSLIIKHSRYKQLIYKHASEILRSQINKAKKKRFNNYKKIYTYFKFSDKQIKFTNKKYSELNLKNILKSKYFTIPNINKLSINFDERFFNIIKGKYFNNFIRITLPYFNTNGTRALTINIPFNNHKHSNILLNEGFNLRNNIQIKKINNVFYINLIWFKNVNKKINGVGLGVDIGYKKLIATSNGELLGCDIINLYNKISNKKQKSKSFKKSLTHRDNEINRICNKLDLSNIKILIIENLKNVKHKSKGKINKNFNNKLQRWSYIKVINKLERVCEVKGIELVKVSPAYTSQTCSSCGNIDKLSRKYELYQCISCGYKIDADINASINIHNRGVYSPSSE